MSIWALHSDLDLLPYCKVNFKGMSNDYTNTPSPQIFKESKTLLKAMNHHVYFAQDPMDF